MGPEIENRKRPLPSYGRIKEREILRGGLPPVPFLIQSARQDSFQT